MLRDAWYTALASSKLRSRPAATRVLDADLVLFRDAGGQPHALLDRCCHRGVRLSRGTVAEGDLACRYHGWRFNGGGHCTLVPSLAADAPPPTAAKIPAWPCHERDGYVWVWMGDRAPDPSQPAGIDGFSERRWVQGSVLMACSFRAGIENNLDWCHPAFAHPWTHPQYYITRIRGLQREMYEVRRTCRGMKVFTPPTPSEQDPAPDQPLVLLEFELPNRVQVSFTKPVPLTIVMHFVPTGPSSCRLEWLRSKFVPVGSRARWSRREPVIFRQDRVLLESAQPWYDHGSRFECSVPPDASTLLARRILDLAERGEWQAATNGFPARRIVDTRV
jgi:phenylpropionate dioxygenase-like ring-hydroxylating dioxygenase large terminal subunit